MGFIQTCPGCGSMFAGDDCPTCVDTKSRKAAEQRPFEVPGFEILGPLGHGGMGVVYKARQLGLERRVAIKTLDPAHSNDPEFQARFEREAKAMAALVHPNIAAIHGFGEVEGVCYLAMDLVEGPNLRRVLEEKRALPPAEALRIVGELCDGLEAAHAQGVVHRDLKPENIVLDASGRVTILDFGLAKMIRPGTTALTAGETRMGTAHYVAPEQERNPKAVDGRADLFSLGVLAYEMLTGEPPAGRFEPPSRRAAVGPGVDAAILRALEPDPDRRWSSVAEFRAALSARPKRRIPPVAILAAALVVLAGTVVALASRLGAPPVVAFPRYEPPPRPVEPSVPKLALSLSESGARIRSLAAAPDGRIAATCGDDRLVRVWDVGTGQQLHGLSGHPEEVCTVVFSPDGRRLASVGGDGTVRVWDPREGKLLRMYETGVAEVIGVAWSQDGRRIVATGTEGKSFLFDAETGAQLWGKPTHRYWCVGLAFDDREKLIYAGVRDGYLYAWSQETGDRVKTFSGMHKGKIRGFAASSDLARLYTGASDELIRIWDVASGREVRAVFAHTDAVYALALSPDGRWLLSGGADGGLKIFAADEVREVCAWKGHAQSVGGVAWLPDGRLLTAGFDGVVKLWSRP